LLTVLFTVLFQFFQVLNVTHDDANDDDDDDDRQSTQQRLRSTVAEAVMTDDVTPPMSQPELTWLASRPVSCSSSRTAGCRAAEAGRL